MDDFWKGFYKKSDVNNEEVASRDLGGLVAEFNKKSKKDPEQPKNLEIDPQTLSQSFTPDTYWRSWP